MINVRNLKMGTRFKIYLTVFSIFANFVDISYGCQMQGVNNWVLWQNEEILDTFTGIFVSRTTTNILGINTITFNEGLNAGPYMDISHSDSTFVIQTNSNYSQYEMHETLEEISIIIVFACTGGSTNSLAFLVTVKDTNNNYPLLGNTPSGVENIYEFTVIPPLPPGYQITNMLNSIIVKDIDLTTQRIIFEIFDSSLFEITYDATPPIVAKEFRASLRSTTLIRNIPEPIEFRISATDVDLTGDPPLTTYATVRIISDGEFELPDELIFTETFYMATYTENNEIVLQDPISLRQGYHEQVQFVLVTDAYSHYFDIIPNANDVTLRVITPIPDEMLSLQRLFLVVRADRENTSGTSATVILELPEEVKLEFENLNYDGEIVDNVLQLPQLVLSQGYENHDVTVEIQNDHASYFSYTIEENIITLAMSSLTPTIIEQNNFLILRVIASTNRSSASTVVTLNIVKDDTLTPVFERTLYSGTYDTIEGLTLMQIVLVQGYDDTVEISLSGDHQSYFQLQPSGANIDLIASAIPTELFREQHILLTIEATKPRTVGASAAVSIALPPEILLQFEALNYNGIIVDNDLQLAELVLSQGYENEPFTVTIDSDYASYFSHTINDNRITLTMSALGSNVIEQNTFLNLQVVASTSRSSAATIVTLEIIKDDTLTPVFQRVVYTGIYDTTEGLTLEQIVLVQGYDDTVNFSLTGDHQSYFQLQPSGANINLIASAIPTELFREQHILLTIEATKPRTVGASAAVSIALPPEILLQFEAQNYNGIIVDNDLQLAELVLSQGYENEPFTVTIDSDYASYFSHTINENRITLTMSALGSNVIEQNTFLNLQVVASTSRSSAATIVTLEIIEDDTLTPVFQRAVYTGTYDTTEGLTLEQIVLVQGYDDTVNFSLTGDHQSFFEIVPSGPNINLVVTTLPTELFREQHILLTIEAEKPRTVGANAVVFIALPQEILLEFQQPNYNGVIVNNTLQLEDLMLSQGYENEVVNVIIQNEYSSSFTFTIDGNIITLSMTPLDANVIEQNSFLNLIVVASTSRSSASTTVTLEIVKDDIATPAFERVAYSGSYSLTEGLTLEPIVIVQGYDDTVELSLEGDQQSYFEIVSSGPNINLSVLSSLPPELFSQGRILLSIIARKPRTVGANAAISIDLPEARKLEFSQDTYRGAIQENSLTLGTILLTSGYTDDVNQALTGDYSNYFIVTRDQNEITVSLREQLPDNVILENSFLLLSLSASAQHAVEATATILLEIIKEDAIPPLFSQNIYVGTYSSPSNLEIPSISLTQGYDNTVSFQITGEHSEYFLLSATENNPVLTLQATIPDDVIFREKVLLFNIVADKPLTVGANAVVSITFPTDLTEPTQLAFSETFYTGTLDQNVLTLENIVLNVGYATGTSFTLYGDFSNYFSLSYNENIVTISRAANSLPPEILDVKFIALQLEANRERAVPVSTTVIIDIVQPESIILPVFGAPFYRGVYTEETGLQFEQELSLSQGYDDTVTFELGGANSQWFDITQNGNSPTITVAGIPDNVLENNHHLLFTVAALKVGAADVHATVVVDLPKGVADAVVLRFTQPSYVGQIQNNTLELAQVTLAGVYDMAIQLTKTGEYSAYFELTREANLINVELISDLPSQVIEENAFITVNVEASYPDAISGYTTFVVELVKEPVTQIVTPVFEQAYYAGQYSEQGALVFENTIQLIQGFDETVSFTLEGGDAMYFQLVHDAENSLTLSINGDAIQEVNDRTHLIFSVVANKPESVTGEAAIVITLTDFVSASPIRFAQDFYVGSIDDSTLTLNDIILEEGYSPNVYFSLSGEYEEYFDIHNNNNNGIVELVLRSPLSPEITNNYNVLTYILEASDGNIRTHTIIVLELVKPRDALLSFEETYYVASYDSEGDLTFENQISLSQGYDNSVVFVLEGANSQWFDITQNGNSPTITVAGIPDNVLENNHHLLFTVAALKVGAADVHATVVVDLPKGVADAVVLRFTQPSYVGQIQNNTLELAQVTLAGVYDMAIQLTKTGEYSAYFELTREANLINVELISDLPSQVIEENAFITVNVEASYPDAISGYTTFVVELVKEPVTQIVTPVFEQAYYAGQYSEQGALVFENTIQLIQGFDETVSFTLEGGDAMYFQLVHDAENSLTLSINGDAIQEVNDRTHLIFSVVANKPESVTGEAAIVITLTASPIRFAQDFYVGSIDDGTLTLNDIILEEGYSPNVYFSLSGEYEEYFDIHNNNNNGIVELVLRSPLSPEITNNYNVLTYILEASDGNIRTHTIIVLELVKPRDALLSFEETYYVASYDSEGDLTFENQISLSQGYDNSVVFVLEGENTEWFTLDSHENVVTLTLSSPIPPAVVANNQQLFFIVAAERPGSTSARATIVILLPDDVTGDQVLGFDRISYVGSIQNNTANLVPIVLNEGFTPNVVFSLHGELSGFFTLQTDGPIVMVDLAGPIPEGSIPTNRLIVLEILATEPLALPAYATIVFGVLVDEEELPASHDIVFEKTYYVGSYTAAAGLALDTSISLAEGYDSSVTFTLEGEESHWFTLDVLENDVTLSLTSPIPPAVVANNQQLFFIVAAERPGSTSARATIVILLPDDVTGDQVLGFDRISYVGSIQENTANLVPIVLNEGFTPNVVFSLHGELSGFFTLQTDGPIVMVDLAGPIPEGSIPTNRLIVLEIQATEPLALPAYATIVFGVLVDEEELPASHDIVFEKTYYVGSYTAAAGLALDTSISLAEGYDSSVTFTLEGEESQWFTLDVLENDVTLSLTSPIPPAVVANNQQLFFIVAAERPGSTSARATIVILLPEDVTGDQVLGFDRISYVGSIQENTANLVPIVLNEGFTPNVVFSLHGELSGFFTLQTDGPIVMVDLAGPIPEGSIPTNRLIVLEIQATEPLALPAYATIVFGVLVDEEELPASHDIVFEKTYYVGSYTAAAGLALDTSISLAEGYDSSVTFTLEGEESQWFTLDVLENDVTLSLTSPIPPAVVANNQQFFFIVAAERPGSTSARATIVILLPDDVTGDQVLGFDRISYVGSIQENTANLVPIVLNEGFTPNVVFSLHGELSGFFTLQTDGPIVMVDLAGPIPEGSIPTNRLIVLEIQATEPLALPAYATIVFGVLVDEEELPASHDIVFEKTYYVGSYTAAAGLALDTSISLAEGYDSSVTFTLEGEESQWFTLDVLENDVTLSLTSPIPPAVVANNQQFFFIVAAERPGSTSARATIVILLPDDVTGDQVLGFDRISYVGSIQENTANLVPIVLNEGFTPNVVFSLHGELSGFFTLQTDGPIVMVDLAGPIPEGSIPTNRLIVLEIQATEPLALPAYATIVFGVLVDEEELPASHDIVFEKTYYVGSYTAAAGLALDTSISLAEGYDSSVTFTLEGEESQWFTLDVLENDVTLSLTSPIPPAVVANNQQFFFIVAAERPGSTSARATIVILLPDNVTGDQVLGFDRISYVGSIQENTANLVPIVLNEGFTPNVVFSLHGELSGFFTLQTDGPIVMVDLAGPIPEGSIPTNRLIVLEIQATEPSALPAYATIVFEVVLDGDDPDHFVTFGKVLYEGRVQGGVVQHEAITINKYDGDHLEITGIYGSLFSASHSDGVVSVQTAGTLPLPIDVQHVVLELRAANAAAVLILDITGTDPPEIPNVTFSSSSYVIRAETGQTGAVGRVEATADNGESITYSLQIDNEHLLSRLTITNDGELRLSAPTDIGVYNFQVVATTLFTGTDASATVDFSVETAAEVICENDMATAPLIVINRDEEESHRDLVVLSTTQHANCHYSLANLWPVDQSWLYVDETGLHTQSIDREDPSIAFMALSQVQVELTLHCDNDAIRTKRSMTSRNDWLGPYDYGTNTWLLGNTIEYNPRRTIVNLIVNDINDNSPIFIGKENEPIVVGYPVPDFETTILPRSLIEVKATDADIGENAALLYWSSEQQLAVSPTTGFVHLRNDAELTQDMQLVISATDLNGQGRTGTIALMVKLLEPSNIAVVTVQDAFLEDEGRILSNLSTIIGYEVKSLRSVVVSDSSVIEEDTLNRRKRQVAGVTGASLEIYVYGLENREPVTVEKLSEDIAANADVITITVIRILTLEEYLESQLVSNIANDTALLAATIVLSILLFIFIVTALVWFLLKRRKDRNYDQFRDSNSLASQIETPVTESKPDNTPLHRLNLEELKRSEKRLQDMLKAPIEEVSVEPTTSAINAANVPVIDPMVPIVVQDRLKDVEESDDDEFGERKKARRKSVVTFNENVEKIITVEDNPDATTPELEIYQL